MLSDNDGQMTEHKSDAPDYRIMIMRELFGKKKMALVVIDAQRKFCNDRPDWTEARDAAVTRMNRLMYLFRAAGAPIIIVQYEGDTICRPYEGDDGDEYFPGLAVRPEDPMVLKRNMNSFLNTNLEEVIKSADADMILICGTVSQYCVMSAYYAAMDRAIVPYIAQKATITTDDAIRDAAEVVCKTLEEDYVARFLGVDLPPEGEIPVTVSNVIPEWDNSRICDIAALANSGGGHFVVGYPKGLKDNAGTARKIRELVKSELGIDVKAEPIDFCAHPSVDVVVEPSKERVVYGGQCFTAVKGYGY